MHDSQNGEFNLKGGKIWFLASIVFKNVMNQVLLFQLFWYLEYENSWSHLNLLKNLKLLQLNHQQFYELEFFLLHSKSFVVKLENAL